MVHDKGIHNCCKLVIAFKIQNEEVHYFQQQSQKYGSLKEQ